MNLGTKVTLRLLFCLIIFSLIFPLNAYAEGKKEVIQSETGVYYTIKKGDTLWDLSEHFNNSPWLWNELWEENDHITNPHWIYPGEKIRLYRKSGSHAYAPKEITIHSQVTAKVDTTETVDQNNNFNYAAINSVGFIRKIPVEPNGEIFKVKDDKEMISEGDHIYVRHMKSAGNTPLIPGSQWTVFRHMSPTQENKSRNKIGTQHYILGIVEIISKESSYSMAKVVKSFRTIKINDLLMPFERRKPIVTIVESTPGIEGKIITSETHKVMIGDFSIAFIDQGKKDNIKVGQLYSIYYQDTQSLDNNGKNPILLSPVDIGSLLVLHTEEETSTVIITKSIRKITSGEKFRTPE